MGVDELVAINSDEFEEWVRSLWRSLKSNRTRSIGINPPVTCGGGKLRAEWPK